MSLSELGIKPEGQPVGIPMQGTIPQGAPQGGLSQIGAAKATVAGPLILDEPLKTVTIGGKKVTLKESMANALILANEDMKADTGEEIKINESFRSGEQQAKTYGKLNGGANGRVAPPGSSFHQTGQAIDVGNWEAAAPYLNKYNLANDLSDDKGHFSIGEFSEKPPITSRDTSQEITQRIMSGEDTQSIPSIAMAKFKEQGKGLSKFAEGLQDKDGAKWYNPLSNEAFKQGFLLIPKAVPALAAELFKRGYAVGDASVDQIMAGKTVIKMLAGQPISEQELSEMKSSNRNMIKSLAGLVELIPDPRTQFVAGMAKEQVKTEEKGGTAKEGLVRGAIQGTEQALLIAVLNRIFGKLTGKDKEKLVKEAEAQGIKKADIDAIAQKKVSAKEAKAYLDAAEKSQGSRAMDIKRPTDMVGDDLRAAQKELKANIDDYGKKIGEVASEIKASKGTFSVGDLADDFTKNMRDLNIKVKQNGTLDFSKSDIAGLPADQKLIQSIWDSVKPTKFGAKSLNVRDAIALNRNVGNQIYSTNQTSALTASESVAARFRDSMRDKINQYATEIGRPELADYNQAYHELTRMESVLDKAITPTGTKAMEFLRRAYSNVASQPKSVLTQLQDMAEKYGFTTGKGLYEKGNVAIATENVSGLQPPTSLGGITSKVGEDIAKNPTFTNALNRGLYTIGKNVKEYIFGGSATPSDTFRKLIDKGVGVSDLNPPTGTLSDSVMRSLNIPSLLKGAAPSTLLDKLQSIGIKNEPKTITQKPSTMEGLASLMNSFIPTAQAKPNLPNQTAMPKLPTQPKPAAPKDGKTVLDYVFPDASAQVRGLADLAKKLGQLTPAQLEAAAPKAPAPKKSSWGLINQMNENKRVLEDQMKALDAETKPKLPNKPIAQLFAESDTGKAAKRALEMFKQSFNIK